MSRAAMLMEEDARRAKNRCPACAKLQLQLEKRREVAKNDASSGERETKPAGKKAKPRKTPARSIQRSESAPTGTDASEEVGEGAVIRMEPRAAADPAGKGERASRLADVETRPVTNTMDRNNTCNAVAGWESPTLTRSPLSWGRISAPAIKPPPPPPQHHYLHHQDAINQLKVRNDPIFQQDLPRTTFLSMDQHQSRRYSQSSPEHAEHAQQRPQHQPLEHQQEEQQHDDRQQYSFEEQQYPFGEQQYLFGQHQYPFGQQQCSFGQSHHPFEQQRQSFDQHQHPFEQQHNPFEYQHHPFEYQHHPFGQQQPFEQQQQGQEQSFIEEEEQGQEEHRSQSPVPSPQRDVVCNHCLCRDAAHGVNENGRPNCCATPTGSRHRMCSNCRRPGSSCVNNVAARVCPLAGQEEACRTLYCTHCRCGCGVDRPHKFDEPSQSVIDRPRLDQQLCGLCLGCWSGWCMPHTGNKRKRAGKNLTSEEAFAKSWGAGRDADVYLLTGLFDQRTGLLPEGSFPRDVFGPSLRYLKSFAGRLDVHQVLLEAGIAKGKGSAGIGEAWSGGGSQHRPERPGGARKVVGAPLRQGLGADKYFSRRHGRRDHNWQWNMDNSPWALGLMAKGRLALGVPEEEANEFEEAGIIAFPGSVVKHKDTNKNGGYGKTIGTVVLRSPEQAFVCLQIQGKLLSKAIDAARERRIQLPPKFETKGRFKFAINELDAWGMVGGAARNEAEHAVVCGRSVIPRGEPGEGFVRLAFNMRWGWQDDPKV